MRDRKPHYTSFEDVLLLMAGPRTQKSVAFAIPTVLAAPGCCFATSNKPGVYNTTAPVSEQTGKVWAFDPQGITGTECEMYWNPRTHRPPHRSGPAG